MRETPTGAEAYLAARLADREFAAAYRKERARIEAIDQLIRALDRAREQQGLSKAELARRVGMRDAALRRLFTAEEPNPTLGTILSVAHELGLQLEIRTATEILS